MEKLREDGGIKLINIKLKSETPKVQWLTKIVTEVDLRVHLHLFNALIGIQKGGLQGQDIIFAEHSYVTKHLQTNNIFYFEALYGISKLDTAKHYQNVNDEHLFYNQIFVTTMDEDIHERTLTPFYANQALKYIKTYGDLLKPTNDPKVNAVLQRKKQTIHYIRDSSSSHQIIASDTTAQDFKNITQKFLYSALILQKSTDHIYQTKWYEEDLE